MRKLSLLTVFLVIFAAGCGSSGIGDLGGILGSPSSTQSSDVRATVNFVDTSAQRIDVNANYINNLKNTQSGQSIYYDSRTRVVYNNQQFRPEDLERGDEISVVGYNNSGRYVADTITVTRNVRQ